MTTIYGTLAGALAYHAERNNAAWAEAPDDATRSAALLVASEWIDGKYRGSFPGWKTGYRAQEREWPRAWAYDRERNNITSTEIPIEVENATYEAALRQITTAGSLLVDTTLGARISEVAVSGAVSVKYQGIADAMDLQLSIPAVDRILAPILTGAGSGSALSGASVLGSNSGLPGNTLDQNRPFRH